MGLLSPWRPARTHLVPYEGESGALVPLHHDQTLAKAVSCSSAIPVGTFPPGRLAAYAMATEATPEFVR